jgi:hypothetical protein
VRVAAANGTAAEPRGRTWRRCHSSADNGFSEWCVRLGGDEALALSVVDGAIEILGCVVLVVVGVLVTADGLRLRVVEVFLVERSNAVGAVLRVLFRIIVHRGHRA